MANIRVPSNCQGMTLTTSGAVTATNNIIAVTAVEATDLSSSYSFGPSGLPIQIADLSTGAVKLNLPLSITNITIASVGYAVSSGISAAVPAAAAAAFIFGMKQRESFELVNG